MPRTKKTQSKHDALVAKLAEQLKTQGHDVKADVSGFPKPETFSGLRPDIIAKKGGKRKILEVETPDSLDTARDLKQKRAFQSVAKRSNRKPSYGKRTALPFRCPYWAHTSAFLMNRSLRSSSIGTRPGRDKRSTHFGGWRRPLGRCSSGSRLPTSAAPSCTPIPPRQRCTGMRSRS